MDVATLIARLSHTDYSERRRAEEALVALGESTVLPLIEVVETQATVPALRAAQALFRLGDPRGVLPVAHLFLRDNRPRDVIAMLADWNAAAVGSDPVAQELIALARKCREETNLQAFTGLVSYGVTAIISQEQLEGKLIQAIRKHSPGWAPPIQVGSTGSFSKQSDVSALIQALRSSHHEQRNAATSRLIELGKEAVPALIDALTVDSALVRNRAAEALGKIGDPRAVEPLLKLTGPFHFFVDGEVTAKALASLAQQLRQKPSIADIPPLVLLVRHLRFSDPDAADNAAAALNKLAKAHPTPALRGALKWLRPLGVLLTPTFREAYEGIEEATKQWKDLPLTATAPVEATDLPLPATAQEALGQREGESKV